jgi:CBS domain-containing protein
MKRKRVSEILQPYREGLPLVPSVSMDDRIIHAIELMVNNNLKCVAVLKNQRPVGMVRLEDAFQKLGLRSWQRGKPEPLKLET